MSKANVAQEPSMDEILASIRRIIETGEDRSGAAGTPVAGRSAQQRGISPDPLVDLPATSFADAAPAGSEPSTHARAQEAIEVPPVEQAPLAEWSDMGFQPRYSLMSAREESRLAVVAPLAPGGHEGHHGQDTSEEDGLTAALESELAASWGQIEIVATRNVPDIREGDHEGESGSRVAEAPAIQPMATRSASSSDMPGEVESQAGDAEPIPVSADTEEAESASISKDDPMRHEPSVPERGAFEPANTDERPNAPDARLDASRYAPFEDTAPSLSSQMTGSLVTASFDELAQAIRNGELKSLETMAQDMLRPMLQEWLDDNLPRMVERLVREEIERMARGGRR